MFRDDRNLTSEEPEVKFRLLLKFEVLSINRRHLEHT